MNKKKVSDRFLSFASKSSQPKVINEKWADKKQRQEEEFKAEKDKRLKRLGLDKTGKISEEKIQQLAQPKVKLSKKEEDMDITFKSEDLNTTDSFFKNVLDKDTNIIWKGSTSVRKIEAKENKNKVFS